jgi:hypothetical protein
MSDTMESEIIAQIRTPAAPSAAMNDKRKSSDSDEDTSDDDSDDDDEDEDNNATMEKRLAITEDGMATVKMQPLASRAVSTDSLLSSSTDTMKKKKLGTSSLGDAPAIIVADEGQSQSSGTSSKSSSSSSKSVSKKGHSRRKSKDKQQQSQQQLQEEEIPPAPPTPQEVIGGSFVFFTGLSVGAEKMLTTTSLRKEKDSPPASVGHSPSTSAIREMMEARKAEKAKSTKKKKKSGQSTPKCVTLLPTMRLSLLISSCFLQLILPHPFWYFNSKLCLVY